MGIGNVTLIQTTWAHLPDQQHRLAVFIGRVAKDGECEFYGGRELLAQGLGRQVPDEPADDDDSDTARQARRVRRATFEAVRHCMRRLEQVGFLEQNRKPARGQTTRYKVNPTFNGPERVWSVTGQSESGLLTASTDQSESGLLAASTDQTKSVQQARRDLPTDQTRSANGPDEVWPKEEEEEVNEDLGEDPTGRRGQPPDRAGEASDESDSSWGEAETCQHRRRTVDGDCLDCGDEQRDAS